jgi:hypothetical protein
MGSATISNEDAALLKQAIQRASVAPGVTPVKIWRVINRADQADAVSFVNLDPPQGAGEAAFSLRPDGTVDTYYFL